MGLQSFVISNATAISNFVHRLFHICGGLSSWSSPLHLCSGGLWPGEKPRVRFTQLHLLYSANKFLSDTGVRLISVSISVALSFFRGS